MSARRERGQANPTQESQAKQNGMNLSEMKEKTISDLNAIARTQKPWSDPALQPAA